MHYTTSGKVHTDGIIELPENWQGNIKPETISVQVTPIGTYQESYNKKHWRWFSKCLLYCNCRPNQCDCFMGDRTRAVGCIIMNEQNYMPCMWTYLQ